jgi:ATP-dependent Lon protease
MPEMTQTLPLLPLTSGVVLPGMVFTMALESEEARVAAEAAHQVDGHLVLVPRLEGHYASVGVVAEILEEGQMPGGQEAVMVRGVQRAHLGTAVPGTGKALWVQVEPVNDPDPSPRLAELAREYRAVLENILLSRGAREVAERLLSVTDPAKIADLAGYSPDLSLAQKLQVLETLDVEKRLELVLGWARDTLADLAVRRQVKASVEEGMEKQQREFLLRRQLEAIRKELGQLDGSEEEGTPEHYRTLMAGRELPEHVRAALEREVARLERTSEQSPERSWAIAWLDTVLELPWGVTSEDRMDVRQAAQVLDEDHEGLEDVKERILEFLAVKSRQAQRGLTPVKGRGAGVILALVGPPGVGKTSLGESVARALGRKFVRVSLGGVHDEAEIRGHRRTYVGAQPGRLARALREAGTMNPVLLLDEVDKVGSDYRGDPASALLEVLDPAQNHTFRDNYLEVELDLSKVLFIATANVTETIPGPLLDRLDVLRIDGYTDEQKLAIARRHLLPRQLERAALADHEVEVSDDALRAIASDYTREGGVRNLEREIARLLRKVTTKLAAAETEPPVRVDGQDIRKWLGRPRFFFEAIDRTSVPGVATGLAVTGVGGDVLFIEATAMDGPEGLTLTGQLGEVMKESAEIALSYVRAHAHELGVAGTAFTGKRFHLHVPAGAVPKDGPSAGVTMVTALTSLLLDRPVLPTVGMTGEVTLQGRVLPIGGVKQKVLAAQRAGLRHVILPARNGDDLDDVPQEVRSQLTFTLADRVEDVLGAALQAPAEPAHPGPLALAS